MAKTFKVGDKVRILDVNKIAGGNSHWSNGDIAEVLDVREYDGGLRLTRVKTGTYNGLGPVVIRREFAGIELVDATPTKKQRIESLENEVEALKSRIEALETGAIKNDEAGRDVADRVCKALSNALKPQTPNQRRKAVIERAKAFVADVEKKAPKGCGKLNWYVSKPEYHINKEKRVVTVLVKWERSGDIIEKSIARCAPGDVFNEHIGKAIALAKAYGLDCPKEFTDAPQPEIVVGQVVRNSEYSWLGDGKVSAIMPNQYVIASKGYTVCDGSWNYIDTAQILDDTEALYD